MSPSTHGRTRQFIGRIEVPSKANIPCFDIQTIIDEVEEIDCGDHGVQLLPIST